MWGLLTGNDHNLQLSALGAEGYSNRHNPELEERIRELQRGVSNPQPLRPLNLIFIWRRGTMFDLTGIPVGARVLSIFRWIIQQLMIGTGTHLRQAF